MVFTKFQHFAKTILHFREMFVLRIFAWIIFAKKIWKYLEKNYEMRPKILAFFSRNAKRFVRWKPTIHAQMAMSDLQRYPKKIFVKYEIIINFFFLLFILHEGFSGKMTCTFLACKERWKNDVIFNIFIRLIF